MTRTRPTPAPAILAALLLLAACVPTTAPVTVAHYGSTRYHEGAQFRLFTFDPREPRSLDTRIRLAKAEIAKDRSCRWANAPREVIKNATLEQGGQFADTMLAAPVICA